VSEQGFEPSGSGEHVLLRVRKTGQNTRWVAKRLAEAFELPYRAVSYAGLKDRHAVAEQWFGMHMPGAATPDKDPGIEGVEVLECARHERKLRPGQLSYNRFRIVLRNVSDYVPADLDERLAQISAAGVPAYFGEQRFGRDNGNLTLAEDAAGVKKLNRDRRAFALSAWRGALFNGYLAERVARGDWNVVLDGDARLSDRPRGIAEEDTSVFSPELLPAGLLWGRDVRFADAAAGELERDWYSRFPVLCSLLEGAGSRASRRVLRMRVAALQARVGDSGLEIEFALGPGSYATTVLRELFDLNNIS
jgi:tRNA pseudouridine13 synthase